LPLLGKESDEVIKLPEGSVRQESSLWEAIARRRSVRRFSEKGITLGELSTLLWASQGITVRAGTHELRAAPSAGALYPIETYVLSNLVEGLRAGLYRYRVRERGLTRLREGELGAAAAEAALDQGMVSKAGAAFIWTAVFARCSEKYRERAYRYVYLDAGHIAAHVSLAAVGLGLGSCQIAAFYDDEVNDLVGADGVNESAVYMTVVGAPAR